MSEQILKENPNLSTYMAPSLGVRQKILLAELPKLGKEAAEKAIKEWGQSKSKITHLIFCTTFGGELPGADHCLTGLLDLNPSIKRIMLYQLGCYGGNAALRAAKDLAENNKGARILVVCSEIPSIAMFGHPDNSNIDTVLGHALYGDGAGACIVGSDPIIGFERPIFELAFADQTIIPDTDGAIESSIIEVGTRLHLEKGIPELISNNIENLLKDAFKPLGIFNWNSIFWVAHLGGSAIFDQVEKKLGLQPEKLYVSKYVLSEYGNPLGASTFFILDEMRRYSAKNGFNYSGEGLEWGVLFGFGPGLTCETMVLRSVSI